MKWDLKEGFQNTTQWPSTSLFDQTKFHISKTCYEWGRFVIAHWNIGQLSPLLRFISFWSYLPLGSVCRLYFVSQKDIWLVSSSYRSNLRKLHVNRQGRYLSQIAQFSDKHLYNWSERGTVKGKSLAVKRNGITTARARTRNAITEARPRTRNAITTARPRTRTARSRVQRSNHLAVAPAHVFVYFWPDFTITSTPKKTPNKPKKETLGVYIVLKHTYY